MTMMRHPGTGGFPPGALARRRHIPGGYNRAMDSPEPAIARWLANGASSRTHPVLDWALRTFFGPLGITADSLECEPFSALESGLGDWWLRLPGWDPRRLDPRHAGAPDFSPLLERPDCFSVAVDSHGQFLIGLKPGHAADLAARQLWEGGERGWRVARHGVRAAQDSEAFIFAAAGMVLANEPEAAIYADGDDAGFCRAVALKVGV